MNIYSIRSLRLVIKGDLAWLTRLWGCQFVWSVGFRFIVLSKVEYSKTKSCKLSLHPTPTNTPLHPHTRHV